MIRIPARTMLPLPFRRRSRRWRAHDSPIHRADYHIFYERCHLFRNGDVRQHTHCADHLTEDEKDHEPDGLHTQSWNH